MYLFSLRKILNVRCIDTFLFVTTDYVSISFLTFASNRI